MFKTVLEKNRKCFIDRFRSFEIFNRIFIFFKIHIDFKYDHRSFIYFLIIINKCKQFWSVYINGTTFKIVIFKRFRSKLKRKTWILPFLFPLLKGWAGLNKSTSFQKHSLTKKAKVKIFTFKFKQFFKMFNIKDLKNYWNISEINFL